MHLSVVTCEMEKIDTTKTLLVHCMFGFSLSVLLFTSLGTDFFFGREFTCNSLSIFSISGLKGKGQWL